MDPLLVGAAEIGLIFGGISRQRVSQLTDRDDFPQPAERLRMGNVWWYKDVVEYGHSHGRDVHSLPSK